MLYPELYAELGIKSPKGVLLHGPPGCGKTLLANCIAAELNKKMAGKPFTYFRVNAPELVSGMSGESESNIRNLFQTAVVNEPSLIFIDEIDVICPKRESASKEMEKRIVAQLLTSFDGISHPFLLILLELNETEGKRVVVLGSTNRADSLDPSLRRSGRFDREIALGVPDEKARAKILQVICAKLKLVGDFDFMAISKKTPG